MNKDNTKMQKCKKEWNSNKRDNNKGNSNK